MTTRRGRARHQTAKGSDLTDEEALLELEARRVRAMNKADPDAMLPLMHDDHVHVMANGVVTDKRGAARGLRHMTGTVEGGQVDVRIWGDLAVLTGPQTNHDRIDGEPVTIRLYVTRVARRTSEGWKFVSMQATRLPAARPT